MGDRSLAGRTLVGLWCAVALSIAACTPASEPSVPTVEPGDGRLDGRLVLVDGGGNIVTMDPDGSNRAALTDDGSEVRYFQPIWSPADRELVWSEGTSSQTRVGFASDDGSRRRSVEVDSFPFYTYWSPDGARVGVLRGGPGGSVQFEIVDGEVFEVGSGSPYYFSWSPDGAAIVAHVDGDRLEVHDESGSPTDIGPTRTNYLAPVWTRAGILSVGADGVVLRADSESGPRLVARTTGFVNIVSNPAGTQVALHTLTGQPEGLEVSLGAQEQVTTNTVTIVDIETGELSVASDRLSVGSFWSPDGRRLLMLLVASGESDVDVAIWEGGETTVVATLTLPDSFVFQALQFFDQYAQSWQMWSPGSEAVVLPGSIGGESGVWVIPVGAGQPHLVDSGEWAAWSHD